MNDREVDDDEQIRLTRSRDQALAVLGTDRFQPDRIEQDQRRLIADHLDDLGDVICEVALTTSDDLPEARHTVLEITKVLEISLDAEEVHLTTRPRIAVSHSLECTEHRRSVTGLPGDLVEVRAGAGKAVDYPDPASREPDLRAPGPHVPAEDRVLDPCPLA